MTNKIYARQVPPEYQESPLFWDENDINAEIYGNSYFRGIRSALFDRLPGILDDLAAMWESIQAGDLRDADWAHELRDVAPPVGRAAYTRKERRDAWPEILTQWGDQDERDSYCAALGLITGRAWDWCTLRGSVQREWQYCLYPAGEWDSASLERLEAEYFNTGTEWIVHDGHTPPDSPEDVDGFSVYCTGWNDAQIRQEIADAAGGSPENVTLYKFSDFRRVAEWEEA